MILLGPGASEAIPNPFCECEVCRKALASSDPREKRGRSAFSIDERNLIDFGPDVISAAGRFGLPMSRLRNIFFTHFHSDHCDFVNWENPRMSVTPPPQVRVFLSEPALTGLKAFRDLILTFPSKDFAQDIRLYEQQIEFIPVRPFEPFRADDLTVSAVKTNHKGRFSGETALNYLFERGGKRFLYASDTGLYCEENYEFLKGKTLDLLILECSFGAQERDRNFDHLTCAHIQEMVERFRKESVVSERTQIYLTHIGHKGGLNHTELQQKMRGLVGPQIDVAYDGLKLADLGAWETGY